MPQAPPSPHRQAPAGEQPSDVVLSHALHIAPAAPHCDAEVAVTQVPSAPQQPLGQDVASHAHMPERQRWPAPQAGFVPQRQAPPEQLSALVASHGVHTAPPVPQLPTPGALQLEPMQHPPAQVVALQPLQRPAAQLCPAGQASHRLPAAPQAAGSSPVTHRPAAVQHPLGQDIGSHMQLLPLHRWPIAHGTPAPQRHSPLDEQLSAR